MTARPYCGRKRVSEEPPAANKRGFANARGRGSKPSRSIPSLHLQWRWQENGIAGSRSPDLLLSNIQMPRMSGADMVQAIRAESAFDGMPIILMSAAAALGEGVPSDGFFEKPFQLDTLIATVARLLGLARVQVNAPGGTGA